MGYKPVPTAIICEPVFRSVSKLMAAPLDVGLTEPSQISLPSALTRVAIPPTLFLDQHVQWTVPAHRIRKARTAAYNVNHGHWPAQEACHFKQSARQGKSVAPRVPTRRLKYHRQRPQNGYIIRPALPYSLSPSGTPCSYVVNGNNRLPACSLSFTLHSGAVRIGMISVAAKETLLSERHPLGVVTVIRPKGRPCLCGERPIEVVLAASWRQQGILPRFGSVSQ